MARTPKTPKTSESVDSVSSPVIQSLAADVSATPAPKAVKKVKAPKEQVSAPVLEVAPVTPTSSTEETVVVDAPVDGETPLAEQSMEFLSKLGQLSSLISSLKTEYRVLEKKWTRELKAAQKQSSKRKRKAGNRAPSGFVKPTRISDELATFLGKDKGSEMARTAVTRDINNYIRTNQLQDKSNGRKINADAKLAALLKLSTTDELTYFNLQKYMSHHFSKNVKAEAEAAVATA
jgi:chromatin remodeling complex protein RSC6